MNPANESAPPPELAPEDYQKVRAVFEPMKQKFARLAETLPNGARPALRFEAPRSANATAKADAS